MDLLNFESIRIAVALIGVGAAAYQDYKTSFIDEKIIYLILGIGFFLNLIPFILSDDYILLYTIIVSIIILAFGYVFYKKGQLGMGDVLLFVAIQQILPLAPTSLRFLNPDIFVFPSLEGLDAPFLLVGYTNVLKYLLFFLTIFLLSSFLATLGSSLQYAIRLLASGKKLRPNKIYGIAGLFGLIIGLVFLYLNYSNFGFFASFMFLLLFVASVFFITFKDQILEEIVIRKIPISQIEDEDILAIERMPSEIVKKYKLEKVLTEKQVAILELIEKKEKIKLFPVNKVLPRFGPYIFLALVIGILFGNIIEIIFFLKG